MWNATDTDTVRLLAGRGLQLPSIYDFMLQDLEVYDGQNYIYAGQPALRPATISNVELSWDRHVKAISSSLHAAAFVQRTDDVLTNPYDTEPIGNGLVVNGFPELIASASNIGHSSAIGGEIELRGRSPSGLRWNASYSYVSISDHLSVNTDGIFSPQDYQHGTPTHSIVLGAGYTRGSWDFDLQGRWQSHFIDYRADPNLATLQPVNVGNYLVLNAHVSYRLTSNVTLGVTGQQFNTSHLLQAAAPSLQRRIFATVSCRF